jgi:hypothetical protein
MFAADTLPCPKAPAIHPVVGYQRITERQNRTLIGTRPIKNGRGATMLVNRTPSTAGEMVDP